MKQTRVMNAGPEIDALIAEKFLGAEVKPYSTNADYTAAVCSELGRRGYEVEFDDDDGVNCILNQNGRAVIKVWGLTFEEAACRAALKLMGSDPA